MPTTQWVQPPKLRTAASVKVKRATMTTVAATPPSLARGDSAPTEQLDFQIEGLDCTEEATLIRRELAGCTGVCNIAFHIIEGRMTVDVDRSVCGPDVVTAAVERAGMKARPWAPAADTAAAPPGASVWEAFGRQALVALSGAALAVALAWHGLETGRMTAALLAHDHGGAGLEPAVLALFFTAIIAGLFHSAPAAVRSLVRLRPDMNALVLVSVVGAVTLGELAEAGTLAFLYGLSGLIENWNALRARKAIASLIRISPAMASVIHGEHEHRVTVDRVAVGAQVRVRPGERIPCDGVVTAGSSYVDQALVTGESAPAWKTAGDPVFAGTVNGHGVVELRTTRPASDTTLARIIRMVGESHHHRAQSERFIDTFARYYTPLMFVVAAAVGVVPPLLLAGAWDYWFYQAMLILLISCPCGLAISTPVTIAAGLAAAARRGVLIKGGVHLENLARVRAFAFDKTGVVTQGEPEVRELRPVGGRTERGVLSRLLAIELRSEHPLSRAIVRYAREHGAEAPDLTNFEAIEGRGAEATVDGEEFWVGSARFAREKLGHDRLPRELSELPDADRTVVICGAGTEPWAVVTLSDPVRSEASWTVSRLDAQGIRPVLLTGDNRVTANSVAARVGLSDVRAELLPEDKATAIAELRARNGVTAMAGDGINDSPALVASSVGIALGTNASDLAVESADVVLMRPDLRLLPFLIDHARRARARIIENIALALGAKALFLVVMAFGAATLWMAVAADMGASLLVTFNGLRMLRQPAGAPVSATAHAGT